MERPHFSLRLFLPGNWPTLLGVGLWWLITQLLSYRALMFLGAKVGRLVAFISRERAIITRKNLKLCFPDLSVEEQEALYWQTMESLGRGFFDTGIAWFWPRKRLAKHVEVVGLEHLAAAQSQGQGVLIMGLHFTSLELFSVSVSPLLDHPVDGVVKMNANPVYDYVQRKGRERFSGPGNVIAPSDIRGMVRVLRAGHTMAYLPDQDYGRKHSVFVPFFGVEAATVTAPSQLLRMGRAKVMAYTCLRNEKGSGYRVTIYPDIEGYGKGDEREDALALNAFIEKLVREHPEQYLWCHKRFKTRPDRNRDFYGIKALPSYKRKKARRAKRKDRDR